ncbi:hypothetical protein CCR75_003064 [Bremia lactucae]|uniref:Elicitin n=1 Tax=Bremia lactucae TaxID=4779 RepID=A0A976IME8_BRELC|nr:hypothetical protein CCR75_003064 [Bremia lactucae]
MPHLGYTFTVAIVVCTTLQVLTSAATCTDDEQTTVDKLYMELSSSSACENLVFNSGVTSLDYCMNRECLSVLSDAVDQLPDCTSNDEIDRKKGLATIITFCIGANELLDSSASASASTSASGSNNDFITSGTSKSAVVRGNMVFWLPIALYVFVAW